ncbi:hypothetical protein E6P09_15225 (plasmid) [Haloferax mediterranei ATCC 33500]|uniref:Uncharacterized protein n=1 Tax=Haloferax mediterranei (strain ATCC 33500 / DSM 1411 / JCM 8866 / NBRC 14739 / NCIMB 2177 / R-4) TaxID=523841 RepID=A0A4P8P7J6_HALMT|nr:hypothetical protein [Haloferax mediterranei]MDX5990234.1 hypothetical protein [Haloferax mediterranei ATCC 33500]QCQ76695.1 hypothetical protein E6P09_15225 [Haloferax mediterranei ATCC 33500]
MVEKYKEDMSSQRVKRRGILKNIAAIGALSATAPQVSASTEEEKSKLNKILNHEKVNQLLDSIPGLELNRESATIYGNGESAVAVPSNYGKLFANTHDNIDVSFYLDEWGA